MTPRLLAIIEAARDPHRRGKLTNTEILELADAAAATLTEPAQPPEDEKPLAAQFSPGRLPAPTGYVHKEGKR